MRDLWIYRLQTGSEDSNERMMKAIEHRGPDSEGSFCREKITLGFRRLSIIDLEDGQQPMESADGICILFLMGKSMIIRNCGQNLRLPAFLSVPILTRKFW